MVLFGVEQGDPAPRQFSEYEEAVLERAIAMQQSENGLGGDKGILLQTLETMREKMQNSASLDRKTRAEKIIDSLERNPERTRLRKPEDLDDPDLVIELLSLSDSHPRVAGLLKNILETRKSMQQDLAKQEEVMAAQVHALRQDTKFPVLLANDAFLQQLDTDPANGKGLLVFGDVSNFKKVNDTYGMEFIDKVLLHSIAHAFAPSTLGAKVQCEVVSSRVAGDEFVVFFRGAEDELEAAHLFARAFTTAVQNITIKMLDTQWDKLSERMRMPIDNESDPTMRSTMKKQVLELIQKKFASLQCKMGVVARSGTAKETQSRAEGLMNETKPYKKSVKFPVVLSGDRKGVWFALERKRMAMDGRKAKPGAR